MGENFLRLESKQSEECPACLEADGWYCEDCCDHSDMDGTQCLDCGKDCTEDMAAAAYDRAKDRDL